MTQQEAIREACRIVSLAFHSIGDYNLPSDGFCDICIDRGMNFQNAGKTLDYVRQAVLVQLRNDGHKIAEGFDPETGRELTTKEETCKV